MMFLHVFCSLISFLGWLQNHLIPCPFKFLTGIDCPGCGFQRSFIALIQGNFSKSWVLYPPTIPLILLFIFTGILHKFPIKHQSIVQKLSFILVGNFVIVSYLFKMLHH